MYQEIFDPLQQSVKNALLNLQNTGAKSELYVSELRQTLREIPDSTVITRKFAGQIQTEIAHVNSLIKEFSEEKNVQRLRTLATEIGRYLPVKLVQEQNRSTPTLLLESQHGNRQLGNDNVEFSFRNGELFLNNGFNENKVFPIENRGSIFASMKFLQEFHTHIEPWNELQKEVEFSLSRLYKAINPEFSTNAFEISDARGVAIFEMTDGMKYVIDLAKSDEPAIRAHMKNCKSIIPSKDQPPIVQIAGKWIPLQLCTKSPEFYTDNSLRTCDELSKMEIPQDRSDEYQEIFQQYQETLSAETRKIEDAVERRRQQLTDKQYQVRKSFTEALNTQNHEEEMCRAIGKSG